MKELVVSAVGPDRPGIVNQLAETLEAFDANIADSRMVNFRGQFAVVMLVEVSESQINELKSRLPARASDVGMRLEVSLAESDGDASASFTRGVPYRIKTYAMDQIGLVHRITHLLHRSNVNIEEMQTRVQPGSYTGTPLFSMEMSVTVPSEVQIKDLKDSLQTLCDDLNCDFTLEPASSSS